MNTGTKHDSYAILANSGFKKGIELTELDQIGTIMRKNVIYRLDRPFSAEHKA